VRFLSDFRSYGLSKLLTKQSRESTREGRPVDLPSGYQMHSNSAELLTVFSGWVIGGGLWPLFRRTHKKMINAEIRSDSTFCVQEGDYIAAKRYPIASRKRIALVAHDNQKERMSCWASKQKTRLLEHELYATSHTAEVIARVLNTRVFRLLSGPLGGDQQIGSRIAESKIDVLVFFWDPLALQPHDCDVKALLRLATVYNIPTACNEATADCIMASFSTADSSAINANACSFRTCHRG
jgi:methylglyoxal synthase